MASIRKWKTSYQVRWWELEGGRRVQRCRTCPTKKAATDLKIEVEHAFAVRGYWEPAERPEPEPVREAPDLGTLSRAWLSALKAGGKAANTILGYGHQQEVFLRWLKGDRPGERLTGSVFSESTVTAFYLWLGEEETGRHGKRRSATTRRKYVEVILSWWSWLASKDDWAEQVGARVPLLRHMDIAPALRRRTLAPTWEEMDACILSAAGWQQQLYTVLRFTGLRVQQAMGLRWDDLDLDRLVLHVRPELGKTAQEKQGRWVPVSEHLVEIVAGWGLREGWLIESGRETGAGGRSDRLARSRDARRSWDRAMKKYEVRSEVTEQPHHCFRKGFVSGLKRLGADDEAVEVLVGHSLGLRGIYTDPDAQPLKAAIKLVPAIGEPRVRGAVVRLRRGA